MDASCVQKLKEGFGVHDSLDYRFDTLMSIFRSFLLEPNEELKKELGEILYKELKDLSFKFKLKEIGIDHKAEALRLLGYH